MVDRVTLQGQSVKTLSCAHAFCLAVTTRGDVFSWGSGKAGQLGHRDSRNQPVPRRVKGLQRKGVVAVAGGREHSVAVTREGDVYTWGSGRQGLLGLGKEAEEELQPVLLPFFGPDAVSFGRLGGPITVRLVACGYLHTVVVDSNGDVFTWGCAADGRLGLGGDEDAFEPRRVVALQDERVTAVACGQAHTLVLTKTQRVFSWGRGRDGALGHGNEDACWEPLMLESWELRRKRRSFALPSTIAPSPPPDLPSISSISCGGKHSLAVDDDGTLYTWGRGELGRLGHGDELPRLTPAAVAFFAGRRVEKAVGGGYHSLALVEGMLFSWGDGSYGRLGHGAEAVELLPKEVAFLADKGPSAIFAGAYLTAVSAEAGPRETSRLSSCVLL
eukprot:PLAT6280.1.p1 GENE.PLAT6280.1~~PLAT6280.1.p1  ORF type:complete len:428 (-),score=164.11 PLAT6280.1:164-1324(-)